jgi:hypothetical protein
MSNDRCDWPVIRQLASQTLRDFKFPCRVIPPELPNPRRFCILLALELGDVLLNRTQRTI